MRGIHKGNFHRFENYNYCTFVVKFQTLNLHESFKLYENVLPEVINSLCCLEKCKNFDTLSFKHAEG